MKSKKNKNIVKKPPLFGSLPKPVAVGAMTMQEFIDQQLGDQTWPIWLLPNDFRDWYKYEQKCRKDSGNVMLPDPPMEIIQKVFYNN